jgi:hypothetical protein
MLATGLDSPEIVVWPDIWNPYAPCSLAGSQTFVVWAAAMSGQAPIEAKAAMMEAAVIS